jgi:hypothetical protein
MAANGKNWYDTLLWVEGVIKSCETPSQGMAAKKLVNLYLAKYRDIVWELELYLNIYNRLMEGLDNIKYEKI